MAVDGIAVTEVAAGFVLLWSGYRNTSIKDTLTSFLRGQAPAQGPSQGFSVGVSSDSNSSTTGTTSGTGAGGPSGIAQDALQYQGHPYAYGGAPGPAGANPWDCSSFVNWVLAHDFGMAIPLYKAGQWNPDTHGPATGDYLLWSGAKTIGSSASAAEPGDLCVWQTHMGIAIGTGQMISALNEHLGTLVTTIQDGAPAGEMLFVRRLSSVPAAPSSGSFTSGVLSPVSAAVNAVSAQLQAAAYGWTGAQWTALNNVAMAESGWNNLARNPSSGAFGIAQALGHGTSGTAGKYGNNYGPQYGLTVADAIAANNGSAGPQIRWMLGYIKATYGNPETAWAHEQANHWY